MANRAFFKKYFSVSTEEFVKIMKKIDVHNEAEFAEHRGYVCGKYYVMNYKSKREVEKFLGESFKFCDDLIVYHEGL